LRRSTYVAIAAAWVLSACGAPSPEQQDRDFDCTTVGASCASTCDDRGFESVVAIEGEELPSSVELKAAPTLQVRLVVATAWPDRALSFDRDDAVAWFSRIVNETAEALAPCGIALTVDRAEVIAVPEARLSIVGNKAGSWGGAAPEGSDPDAFNYTLDERIPASAAELFSFARRGAADGAIAVIFVDEIHYWTDRSLARAGGLSYPPVVYHQPEDFPARNVVLVASGYGKCGGLPIFPHPRVVAHELGHMLLDTGQHASDPEDLMSSMLGSTLTPQACARMRQNLVRLYGDPAVIDPGAPTPNL
jgi:hypothetical protein